MLENRSSHFQFYQSANITDCRIVKQNFIVRVKEFELIRSYLFDDKMIDSVQHYLILGRRGSGKSTLLKRIDCEINETKELNDKYISIYFAEEQASIHRLFDLFEEIIKTLKNFGFENLPETDTLDIPDDFAEYSRELHKYIQSALHSKSKKLILLIDNIDKTFLGIKEDAQIFREILLNFDEIKIIGGSTRMSEHFWQYEMPFYQFFRVIKLEALSSVEIKNLLLSWSELLNIKELSDFVKTRSGQIEAVRLLTDGLPRTLQFFVDLLINRPQQNGYKYIQKIMDIMTPLYQERLNTLLPIEQKIVLKLAFIWEAASIRDLVKPTKIESKLLSANLKKLSDIGVVDKILTGKKNHLYRLSERFFNMWLIFTQGNPVDKRKARFLTIFLENFYSGDEIKQMLTEHIDNLKNSKYDADHLTLITKTLSQSKHISFSERDLLIEENLSIETLSENLKTSLPSTTDVLKSRIKSLVDAKKYDEAILLTNDIPNECDGEKNTILGLIYQTSGEFNKAENQYKKAIEKEDFSALFNLAHLYNNQGKYELAENYYLQAIEKEEFIALNNLAGLYFNQEKYELAENYYLQAIEKEEFIALNNLAILYSNQEKYDLAEKYYLQAIEKEEFLALFNLALLYSNQKKYELAEKYYLQAIEKEDFDALNNLALLYYNQEKYELAEKYYLQAIEKENFKALFNLALLYANQEKYELAEKYYLKAIEKEDFEALNNLALLYSNQEKYDLAEKYYLKAIENNINSFDGLAHLYYLKTKNKDSLKKLLGRWDESSINKRQYGVLFRIWSGKMQNIKNDIFELAAENDGIDETFLIHLLVHSQKNIVYELFNNEKFGKQLKDKFILIYYATLIIMNKEENKLNLLKLPPEVKETVQDILTNIEELRKEYYPV